VHYGPQSDLSNASHTETLVENALSEVLQNGLTAPIVCAHAKCPANV